MNLDEELRLALVRREPPDGFVDRVMARLEHQPRRSWVQPWMAIAAALLLLAGVLAWQWREEREKRIAAEKAKADLLYALELTDSQLQQTRSKLKRHSLGGLI
ncbi:MAG TPA: hypothetical protein VES20_03820 [Bryobacteraceae bacterium]|nr:hypothetical protein [Bryobacteraceae bacterium]